MDTLGKWFGVDGWVEGMCVHDSHVHELQPAELSEDSPVFIPAPIDLHVHGGGGADVMQGDEALRSVLNVHARYGTGAMLATSVTAPFDQIDEFLASVARVMKAPSQKGAHLLGAHLEGPFINPDKLGAQPDYPAPLNLGRLEKWLATGVVRIITYAPECDDKHAVPKLCEQYGVRAQIGHTLCSWAQACHVLEAGVGVTHLYNAMSAVLHRDGGAALAALAYADYAEIITDGIHVDKAAFDAARRAIPGLYSVTDATSAAGMPDGDYQLGTLSICKQGNRVVLPDGTLAGSCLTQKTSIDVLRRWNLDWAAVASMVSCTPARWIQRTDYGVIAPGARSNWLEVGQNGAIALWLDGRRHLLETVP